MIPSVGGTALQDGRAQSEPVPAYVWFYPALAPSVERELFAFLGTHNGVAVVEWPGDVGRIERLAQLGLPRLLLVHSVAGAPVDDGSLQDWVLSSAMPDEIHTRLRRLCARAAERRRLAGCPGLDGEGRLSVGESFINLMGPTETLARVLVAHFEEAVGQSTLARADPAFSSARRLEGWLNRLSELINPLGLEAVALPDRTSVMRWCRLAIRGRNPGWLPD